MPADRPNADELLEAVCEMLSDLMHSLSGYDAFQVRISISLLSIVRRELELGERFREQEQEQLARLLDRNASLEEMEDALVQWIRDGDLEGRWTELLGFLKTTAKNRLLISNPKHVDAG